MKEEITQKNMVGYFEYLYDILEWKKDENTRKEEKFEKFLRKWIFKKQWDKNSEKTLSKFANALTKYEDYLIYKLGLLSVGGTVDKRDVTTLDGYSLDGDAKGIHYQLQYIVDRSSWVTYRINFLLSIIYILSDKYKGE